MERYRKKILSAFRMRNLSFYSLLVEKKNLCAPKGHERFGAPLEGRGSTRSFLTYSSVTYLLCELVQVTCSLMLDLIYKMGIIKVKVKI